MAINTDLTGVSGVSCDQDQLVVDRVEVLGQRVSSLSLEDPDSIADLLAREEVGAKEKEGAGLVDVQVLTISDLSDKILGHIFLFLDKDGAARAACVCKNWQKLNTYPYGQLPVRIMHWGLRLQSRLSQETYERTSFECLSARVKRPQLGSFSPFNYTSSGIPVSVSEVFVRTDATEVRVAHGKRNLSEELKSDPLLKSIMEEVFAAEKEHVDAYQPFYHSMNRIVYFFGFATKMLLHVMNQKEASSATFDQFSCLHWFRFPQMMDSVFPQTVNEFLSSYPMPKAVREGGDYDDHHKDIKQWIMAVSPFMFSNFSNAGESTWLMFLENQSMYPPDARSYFNALCDQFHLLPNSSDRESYIADFEMMLAKASNLAERFLRKSRPPEQTEIFEFEKRGNRNLGFLFQIFVPKPLVDTIVYPCMEYGIPKEYRNRKMSEVFKQICLDPAKGANISIQARMMTSPLVTPGNGIKVLTYGHNAFFQSPVGIEVAREFQEFFLRVVMDSQVS
ncbi:MAG: F-box protein [Verrucomicrobia bacterium]|nr:F-box protein [Verrucomicrobiota bacterium]